MIVIIRVPKIFYLKQDELSFPYNINDHLSQTAMHHSPDSAFFFFPCLLHRQKVLQTTQAEAGRSDTCLLTNDTGRSPSRLEAREESLILPAMGEPKRHGSVALFEHQKSMDTMRRRRQSQEAYISIP